MNIYSYNHKSKYKSNRGEWPLGVINLEHQDLYVSTESHIPVTFSMFTKYPIKVPTNLLNDPVIVNWTGQALGYWNIQVNFACHCATTALGISAKHLNGSVPLINSIFKFHVYYHMRRILARMKVPMPYDDGFSQYENPYSTSGYAQVCREYGADPNSLYKTKSVSASLTNGRWWPQVEGDWAKFIMPTSQGLTSEGLSKLSESIRVCVILLLGSQADAKASLIGSDADNFTARQILLQKFEAMVQREENVGHDITEFQKVLQYARTPVNFAVMHHVYMLPSDMNLRIGKIVGYNNNILIAPASAMIGIRLDLNNKPITTQPRGLKRVRSPGQEISRGSEKMPPIPQSGLGDGNPHEDTKATLVTAGVGLILVYLWLKK